jgi:hypothetical protein
LHGNKGGLSQCGLAIYYIQKYLPAKEELWKFKYFTMQNYNLQKEKSSQRNQNASRYHNSIITNLKFQHKPKCHLSKLLISKSTYLLSEGQNPLSYYTL